MSESVTITVPARLHLGFLDIPRVSGDRFGSIGLPIQDIATVLTVARAPKTEIIGSEAALLSQHLTTLCDHLDIFSHHRVTVHRTIPRHIGLGSGTQLALAISSALRKLHSLELDIVNDAILLGRGSRSGIGIAAFDEGGVIIDAGKGYGNAAPTVISRIPFPDQWRIILVFDTSTQGMHGEDEVKAFKALPLFPIETSALICRHVVMGVMPALIEKNLPLFGQAVQAVQHEIGRYFAPAQGGIFTSRNVESIVHRLLQAGATGIGQSSWGPTGFAFAASQAQAEHIVDSIGVHSPGATIQIVAGRNAGAEIVPATLNLARA